VLIQDGAVSENRKRLRAELFKFAAKGEFPHYGDMLPILKPRIEGGWRSEWSDDLNQIAMEERSHGYPDLTFILRRKETGYPSQIDFRKADPPDQKQLDSLREGTDDLIALYCPPGTQNPYR
jgi:hypothetical protein